MAQNAARRSLLLVKGEKPGRETPHRLWPEVRAPTSRSQVLHLPEFAIDLLLPAAPCFGKMVPLQSLS